MIRLDCVATLRTNVILVPLNVHVHHETMLDEITTSPLNINPLRMRLQKVKTRHLEAISYRRKVMFSGSLCNYGNCRGAAVA